MAYFPFLVEVSGQRALIVGGGAVALRKAKSLLEASFSVLIVAEDFHSDFAALKGDIVLEKRLFADSDPGSAAVVVAATDDQALNRHIAELCRQAKIPVNVVDDRELSSFLFPAIIRQDDLLITVSSGGQSPAAVAYLKQKIQAAIPSFYSLMVETLGNSRQRVIQSVSDGKARKHIFSKMLAYGDAHDGDIPEEIVEQLIEDANSQNK